MIYADYSYYSGDYMGALLNIDEFDRLAFRASAYLDYYTQGKAAKAAETNEVKMACCALAEQYKAIDTAQAAANRAMQSVDADELKSQSVGSWSKTYQSGAESAKNALTAQENAYNQLATIARQYLSGTGLLYRGRCF